MPDHEKKVSQGHAFWSGMITFGLVSIPVALFPGNRPRQASLRMLTQDGMPLRRRYFCPREERMLAPEEIVRGYEYEKGEYVVIADEELEALEPKKSREIDLRRFVPVEQVPPVFFQRAYILAPAGDAIKPYLLLAQAMERTRRAGIATFVMRGKEYLICILAQNGIIRAETLRFADEIRDPAQIDLPQKPARPDPRADELAQQIRAAKQSALSRDDLTDEFAAALERLAREKAQSGQGIIAQRAEEIDPEDGEGAQVIDLMEVLKRSMGIEGQAPAPKGREQDKAPSQASRKHLYERAKEMDIPGRSSMSKEELAEAIAGREGK